MYYLGIPVCLLVLFGLTTTFAISLGSFYFAKWLITVQMLDLVSLTILDEMFLLDYAKNRANIVTVMKVDKVKDIEEFRNHVMEGISFFKRGRSKLVKRYHEYYYKEMGGEELKQAKLDCSFILKDNEVNSDADIASFIEKEQIIRDPLETLQYRIFVKKDFSETESLLILKQHHCACDGITTLVATANMSGDTYTPKMFPNVVPRMSLFQKVMVYVTLPYSIYIAFMSQFG